MENKKDGAALWIAPKDKKYKLSGKLTIEGKEYSIFVYKNDQKSSERSPDYNMSILTADGKAQPKKEIVDEEF